MKRRFRILSAIIASLIVFSSIGVFAATPATKEGPDENGVITISGTTNSIGELVTLIVMGDTITADNIGTGISGKEDGASSVKEIFTYGEETASDDQKEYAFEFVLSGGSGRYTAYVKTGEGVGEAIKINYQNKTEAMEAAAALNAAVEAGTVTDAATLKAFCSDASNEKIKGAGVARLGFYSDFYDGLGTSAQDAILNLVVKSIAAEKLDTSDIRDSSRLFRLCCVKYAMDNGLTYSFENEIKAASELYASDSCIGAEIKNLKTATIFTALETRVEGAAHTDGRDFEDALEEQLVLTRIENSTGHLDTKKLVETYTGLSTTNITNDEWQLIDKVSYASYSALDEALKPYRASGGGGGGGGGGGAVTPSKEPSGGNDSSTGSVIVSPETPSEDAGTTQQPPLVAGFTDIPQDAWYKEEVKTLVDAGYLSGRGNGSFEPEDNITRCEIAKLLTMIGELEATDANSEFSDVASGHWAYNFIKAAADNGIVSGIGDGKFAPDVNITRQDLAVMISRVIAAKTDAKEEEGEEVKLGFKDSDEASDYAVAAIAELVELGIINGYEDNTFRPQSYITRAEAAKLLCGLLEILG